ncbi:MAG: AI-2E family transporter [Armatimonadota bacterium]|nr:AI-2E family transporter [Armatimonadota bacterium]
MAAVLIGVATYLLFVLRFVLVTVSLAAMLTYAFLPLVESVTRLRFAGRPLPRLAAVTAVFVLIAFALGEIGRLAAQPIGDEFNRFARNVGQYRREGATLLLRTRTALEQHLPPDLQQSVDEAIARAGDLLLVALGNMVHATIRSLSHVVELILVPILAFYFLVDTPILKHEWLQFLPSAARQPVLASSHRLGRIVAGYVRGQMVLMLIAGVVVGVGLALMGVPFALLLGIVAGLTRALPIIGPVLGAIPIVGLAWVQSAPTGLAVLVFFAVLQLVESKVIMPRVIGRELNLHAATIIVALLVGNAVFGLMGMFLAPPAAAFAKELLDLAERGFVEPSPGNFLDSEAL